MSRSKAGVEDRKPFSMYYRELKGGRMVYVQFRGPDGGFLPGVSSGQASKTSASNWATLQLGAREELARATAAGTVGEWVQRFYGPDCPRCQRLEEEGRPLSEFTKKHKHSMVVHHILPDPICGGPLRSLKRNDVLEFRSRLSATLSDVVVNATVIIFKTAIREAFMREIIDRDPTMGVGSKRHKTRPKGTLRRNEIIAFLEPGAWKNENAWLMFTVMIFTGMRTGEARALSWDQLDFATGRLNIDRAVTAGNEFLIGPPKNGKARATALPPGVLSVLRERSKLSGYIFTRSKAGDLFGPQWFGNAFHVALKKAGIDYKARNITPHSLRHTYVTLAAEAGENRDRLRAMTGHSSAAIAAIYTHEDEFDFKGDALMIEESIRQVSPEQGTKKVAE